MSLVKAISDKYNGIYKSDPLTKAIHPLVYSLTKEKEQHLQ